jgi:3-hydroxybenzoate 6-monooxygenase
MPPALPVLIAGGGIGGLAAALALVRQGYAVKVFEQAAVLGEIGAGLQVGPNGFAAFDALGVGERARARAVYTDYMVMHDAIDAYRVGMIRQSLRGHSSRRCTQIVARGRDGERPHRSGGVNPHYSC